MRADGKNLSLTFGAVEVNCVSTSAVLDNEEADSARVTFQDVISGANRRWYFTVTALPDYGPSTLWDLLWTTPAYTPIPYRFAPYGNGTPSPAQPHFTGSVTIDQKPPVGGDAGRHWEFGTRLTCTATPTRVTS